MDAHPIVRYGLTQLLKQEADVLGCGEADGAQGAINELELLQPDLLLLDISLRDGDGLEFIKILKARYPRLLMLVISAQDESIYAERVLRAGARGYIHKNESLTTLMTAIRRVLSGEIYVSSRMAEKMLAKLVGRATPLPESSIHGLSDRELEVFKFIGQGFGTREVAARLGLSVKTVESYRENIKQKMKLKNAAELVRHAIQWTQSQGQSQGGTAGQASAQQP